MTAAQGTDALLVAAWVVLAVDTFRQARRVPVVGAAQVRSWNPPAAVRGVLFALLLAGMAWLERASGGRLAFHPLPALLGLGLVAAGLALHLHARRTLGRHWSAVVTVRDDHRLVTDGAYRVVRHPLYLAIVLLAVGTLLAHPSWAVLCAAIGLGVGVGVKVRLEDRVLHEALGARWERYAERVPALLPFRR
ncbi:MAG: isoprenylcysteine carboxylmethyltransferase family protein [bacterium]|nr:isoprenylcysteine carboxylmethyltransferase family protein [bacterium]